MDESTTRIKQIDKSSIHRICSGQVIFDIASATKELIENSLDAGSTSIGTSLHTSHPKYIRNSPTRFRKRTHRSHRQWLRYSYTRLQRNRYHNPQSQSNSQIARKYHTSKISNYDDLSSVTSFGFRGTHHFIQLTESHSRRSHQLSLRPLQICYYDNSHYRRCSCK